MSAQTNDMGKPSNCNPGPAPFFLFAVASVAIFYSRTVAHRQETKREDAQHQEQMEILQGLCHRLEDVPTKLNTVQECYGGLVEKLEHVQGNINKLSQLDPSSDEAEVQRHLYNLKQRHQTETAKLQKTNADL